MKKLVMCTAIGILMAGAFSACGNDATEETNNDSTTMASKPGVTVNDWGEVDGKKVHLYTLQNDKGTTIKISDYGGTITSWVTADKSGNQSDVVLGFDSLQGYLDKPPYFGATIGRYGNRIGQAKFSLDGNTYDLAANDGKNHLHGGKIGFDKVVWTASPLDSNASSLELNYTSADMEEGYPGNLKVTVRFTLTNNNELEIEYNGETDKATPVNLTNHSYFNLTGDVNNTILNHVLMIDADKFTPVDATLIPTGELKPVQGTPFDFTQPTLIGARIDQVKGGYDHNWVLNKSGDEMKLAAFATDSISGRKLEVYTMEPGIQFYTGNFLNGSINTSNGLPIKKHAAFCLETQHFPDSPNKPSFPSTILRPGEKYHTVTRYKIYVP